MSNATSARWVQFGRSKWHIQRDSDPQTVCGRAVPEDARTTTFSPVGCERCKKDAAALAAAEETRKASLAIRKRALEVRLEAQRAGQFVVYRCRKCGLQHHPRRGNDHGLPFCFDSNDMHEADLEAVFAQGPAWEKPEAA